MFLNVSSTTVATSATTEISVGATITAAASAAAEPITAALPMGADLDSLEFAAALNAAGVAYIATASEHIANRDLFAGAQGAAAVTYTATDVIHNTALAL